MRITIKKPKTFICVLELQWEMFRKWNEMLKFSNKYLSLGATLCWIFFSKHHLRLCRIAFYYFIVDSTRLGPFSKTRFSFTLHVKCRVQAVPRFEENNKCKETCSTVPSPWLYVKNDLTKQWNSFLIIFKWIYFFACRTWKYFMNYINM